MADRELEWWMTLTVWLLNLNFSVRNDAEVAKVWRKGGMVNVVLVQYTSMRHDDTAGASRARPHLIVFSRPGVSPSAPSGRWQRYKHVSLDSWTRNTGGGSWNCYSDWYTGDVMSKGRGCQVASCDQLVVSAGQWWEWRLTPTTWLPGAAPAKHQQISSTPLANSAQSYSNLKKNL